MNNAILNGARLAVDYTELNQTPLFSGERWALAGQMTLLGVVMVFAVLASLWGILSIFQKAMGHSASAPKEPKKAEPVQEIVQPVEKAPVAASSDDEIIAAVIAAAVAAYMAEEGNTESAYNGGFRVVSFRRVQGGKAWNSKY